MERVMSRDDASDSNSTKRRVCAFLENGTHSSTYIGGEYNISCVRASSFLQEAANIAYIVHVPIRMLYTDSSATPFHSIPSHKATVPYLLLMIMDATAICGGSAN
jgi:hypothetical protein